MTVERLKLKPRLRAVPDTPEPSPDLSYEHRERSYVMSRDWSRVHVEGDRRSPISLPDALKWGWR